MSIADALSSINGKFILVKDMSGNVYWPQSVFTLSELTPGKGYMIYMSEPASLIYPANSGVSAKMSMDITENTEQSILTSDFRNTGESSILKLSVAGAKDGDIIGVYTIDKVCAGAASVKDETAVITIWADDFLTDEKEGCFDNEHLSIRLYRTVSNTFSELRAYEIFDITNEVSKAAMEYNSNEIITAKAEISLSDVNEDSKESFLISPMPISSFANITLPSNFGAASVIKIYSTSGELVQEFYNSSNFVRIDFSNFSCGVYNIIISNGNDIISKRILVAR